jgi:hypothetical protein
MTILPNWTSTERFLFAFFVGFALTPIYKLGFIGENYGMPGVRRKSAIRFCGRIETGL